MNVIIRRLNGLWYLNVGSCQIRTPFSETQDRALVVAYARGGYPGADHRTRLIATRGYRQHSRVSRLRFGSIAPFRPPTGHFRSSPNNRTFSDFRGMSQRCQQRRTFQKKLLSMLGRPC